MRIVTWGCLALSVALALPAPRLVADQPASLLVNGSFEEGAGLPFPWALDEKARPKGAVERAAGAPHGQQCLKLVPNDRNSQPEEAFGVGQAAPAARLAGKTARVSAWLKSDGEAIGQVIVLIVHKNGTFELGPTLKDEERKGEFKSYVNSFRVPDDVKDLVVVLSVLGTSGTAWFDDVRLAEGPARVEEDRRHDLEAAQEVAKISVDATHELKRINPDLFGTNLTWTWNANFLWNEKADRLDEDLIARTRDLGVTVMRFPGGFFSDYYHWKDGLGERKQRPVRKHDVSPETSPNNFGTDELVEFATRTDGRLLLTANVITGTPEEAAGWAAYLRSKGALGRVAYWELGNEQYINDGSPVSQVSTRTPEQYAALVTPFARALRQVDPHARILALGAERFVASGRPLRCVSWNRPVLEAAADEIDLLAVHNAYFPNVYPDRGEPVETIYRALLAAPAVLRAKLRKLDEDIRRYAPRRADHIKVAITEWGPFFQFKPNERLVDHVRTLGSALYAASALKVFIEDPRVEVANFFQLCDPIFNGWVSSTTKAPRAPYYAFQLYTRHFGSVLVASATESPTFGGTSIGYAGDVADVPYVEAISARSADGKRLFVLAINKNLTADQEVEVRVTGFAPRAAGTVWRLTGKAIDAHNGADNFAPPGMSWAPQSHAADSPPFESWQPGSVTLEGVPFGGFGAAFKYVLPCHSVVVFELTREG